MHQAEAALRDELSQARTALSDAEDELLTQDVTLAQLTNELRLANDAAAAAAAERAELLKALRKREEALHGGEDGLSLRTMQQRLRADVAATKRELALSQARSYSASARAEAAKAESAGAHGVRPPACERDR